MRLFVWSVAAGLMLAGIVAGASELLRLRQVVATGQEALASASGVLAGGAVERVVSGQLDLDRSCAGLAAAADAFGDAADSLERLGPLLRLVESMPTVQADARLALVALASEVSAAGRSLCEGIRPVAALVRAGPEQQPDGATVLAALAGARPQLEQARTRLARAQGALARVPTDALDPALRDAVAALATRLPALRVTVDALLLAPPLLGADSPRTYLVIAQNRDELRPTGGYVGTAGVVRLANGQVELREFGTSAAFDLPPDRLVPPPAPMARYFRASYWQLRDANWWPDFPSSAEQLAYFYNQVRSEPLDGVIAFDQRALELLLAQLGTVEVPEYGETLSAANLQERLSFYVHDPSVWDQEYQRKAFVGAAAAAVLRTLGAAPTAQQLAALTALGEALASKHLLVYVGAPEAAAVLAGLNWDGHLYRGPGDYVYAVSTNLSQNKVDRYVERATHYAVDLAATPPRARLTLTLRNHWDPAWPTPWRTAAYRDYLRVYVPWESQLVAASGFLDGPEVSVECGRTLLAGAVEVGPGQEAAVVLEYTLNPSVVERGAYALAVQKQPGLDPWPLRVEVRTTDGTWQAEEPLATDRYYRLVGARLLASPLPAPASVEPACATPKPAPQTLAAPVRLAIPRVGIDGPVAPMRVLPNGEMEVPTNGVQIGWYVESARPGYAGNFVATGHVDWGGRTAVFWRLHELRPGDQIVVTDEWGQQHVYAVQWNRAVRPEDLPIQDVVGPSHDKILTLITCTGNFNPVTRDYSHRQIVRAQLVEGGS
jgi:LPXTG-site transpeptidase (sortase) family protein